MKPILLKKSRAIKNNMIPLERYTITTGSGEVFNNVQFVDYLRGEDMTKKALQVRTGTDISEAVTNVPIDDGMVVEWNYTATKGVDYSKDPLTCGRLAEMYLKYGLVRDNDPHSVAYLVLTGWRPF